MKINIEEVTIKGDKELLDTLGSISYRYITGHETDRLRSFCGCRHLKNRSDLEDYVKRYGLGRLLRNALKLWFVSKNQDVSSLKDFDLIERFLESHDSIDMEYFFGNNEKLEKDAEEGEENENK